MVNKIYLRTCPHCDKCISIEKADLDKKEFICPNCGKKSAPRDLDHVCKCGMNCECNEWEEE